MRGNFLLNENQEFENEFVDENTENKKSSFIDKFKSSEYFKIAIIILILTLLIILMISLTGGTTLEKIELEVPSIMYMDETSIVKSKAIGNGKINKTTHNFSISNSNIVDISKTSVVGKEVTTNITPITTGKIKISASGSVQNTTTEIIEKDILICKRLSIYSVQNKTLTVVKDTILETNIDLGEPNECYKNISYKIKNDEIATVSKQGKIIGKEIGKTKLTVSTKTDEIELYIEVIDPSNAKKVTGITLDKTNLTIPRGTKTTVTATIKPADATNKEIIWLTSDEYVADVSNNGEITGIGTGTATITAITQDGEFKSEIKVTVTAPNEETQKNSTTSKYIEETKVNVNKTKTTIKVGSKEKLTATVSPSNATNQSLKWKSSNTSVATVTQSGYVTAHKEGKAKITVTSYNNKKATIEITVTKKTVLVQKITVTPSEITININQEKQIQSTISPSNATDQKITWKTNNSAIATVTNGKIKGKSEGSTTITATTSNGKKANIYVTVKKSQSNTSSENQKDTYTLEYNAHGGTNTMSSKKVNVGTNPVLNDNRFSRSGYKFLGWSAYIVNGNKLLGCNTTTKCSSGYQWYPSDNIKSYAIYSNKSTVGVGKNIAKGETLRMYAQWGKIDISAKLLSIETARININLSLPHKTQWRIETSLDNKNFTVKKTNVYMNAYTQNDYIDIPRAAKNSTVYVRACLEQATSICTNSKSVAITGKAFTIKFLPNYGSGTMSDQNIVYGTSTKINANRFTRTGWTFVGWAAKKSGQAIGCTTGNICYYTSSTYNWHNENNITSFAVYANQVAIAKTVNPGETVYMAALWAKLNSATATYQNNKYIINWSLTSSQKLSWDIYYNGYKSTSTNLLVSNQNTITGKIEVPSSYNSVSIKACLTANRNICTNSINVNKPSASSPSTSTPTNGNFKKYSLSEYQLKSIARLCQQEQGSPKGAAAESRA